MNLVLHPGSALKQERQQALDRHALELTELLNSTPTTRILLENQCEGSELGTTWQELAYLRNHVGQPGRVGLCLDTCHAWASGQMPVDSLLADCERIVGPNLLWGVHLNDSESAQGSRKDRHAIPGQGQIGTLFFHQFMNQPLLREVPGIAETKVNCLTQLRALQDLKQ